MKTLTIIDTFGLFFRLFYALKTFKNSNNDASGMIAGFANFIYSLKKEIKSDMIIFALDSKGETFRNKLDQNYKSNRIQPPKELLDQIPICINMIEKMGFCSYSQEGYEADDIIASLVKICENKDIFIQIISQDKDLYQLIKNNKVNIYSPISKNNYDEAGCLEKYGVYPNQICDFLSLCGDSSDNISGVKGIGAKGAKALLEQFESLENIYNNIDKINNERIKKLLIEDKKNAFLSKKLASLYDELDIEHLLSCATMLDDEPLFKIIDILQKYELNTLLKKINFIPNQNNNTNFESILILDKKYLFQILNNLEKESIIAFDTETNSLDIKQAKIVGFSFCINTNKAFYVPLNHNYLGVDEQISINDAKEAIRLIYSHTVVGHNLKFDFAIIKNNFNIRPPLKYIDIMILAWLYNPSLRVNMDELANRLFDYKTLKFNSIVKNGEDFSMVELQKACKYAAEDAYITLKFYLYFIKHLDKNLLELAFEHEFLFIKLIMSMEENGIKLDSERLKYLMQRFQNDIKNISEKIYELCEEKFNINSPKQLGIILFEKLLLPNSKKNKSGTYVTDEKHLNELLDKHEIIQYILDYREITKLYGTYCEPLLKLALKDKDSRIYSNFLQTGTATGRLSSKEPNLQNIPAHGQYAKDYKSCFIAQDGFSFISLDYSQIELRMLAHFSKDEKLLNAFKNDEDIHTKTAIMIFGESNYQFRSIAKSINFGLIYGMGYKTLSKNLKIKADLAKIYIEKYFENFINIKEYFTQVKQNARQNGFITTLLGRKRYFDFNNANAMMSAAYERESINSILQGSAADIIKLAMNAIYPYLNENKKLILQIHDELIFEVRDDLIDEFANFAKNIMQNIAKLDVSLKSSINIAKNWGELK